MLAAHKKHIIVISWLAIWEPSFSATPTDPSTDSPTHVSKSVSVSVSIPVCLDSL